RSDQFGIGGDSLRVVLSRLARITALFVNQAQFIPRRGKLRVCAHSFLEFFLGVRSLSFAQRFARLVVRFAGVLGSRQRGHADGGAFHIRQATQDHRANVGIGERAAATEIDYV